MAQLIRLYPPNIAGTLPSFYTDSNGITKLVVPFSMNASVGVAEVAGFALRIKTTTTDTLVAIEQKEIWDSEHMTVSFELADDTVNKLVEGNFYKVQLAYFNKNADGTPYIGYYSTASIVKYTVEPIVTIQSLDSQVVNSVTNRIFVGLYHNDDISEKVYQYKFTLYGVAEGAYGASTELITDTDWCIHDSSQDTELGKSSDTFVVQTNMVTGRTYLLTYFIRTTNGLEIASTTYTVVSMANIGVVLPFHIEHTLDYENGRIIVKTISNYWIDPADDKEAETKNAKSLNDHPEYWRFSGSYQLLRTDSNSNYNNWITVYVFSSDDQFSNWSYEDYTVESGVSYKYGIEKVNQQSIRSRRVESATPISAFFEHMFLYDGQRQIRISYNANVSSFKEVISETKKTTLGRKYPVIMRNGTLQYKEFQITGLMSYLADPDELFMTKAELISKDTLREEYMKDHPYAEVPLAIFIESTDLSDLNIAAERVFCLELLNWLNNGKIKLFRSPTEGNYIVKLTNVSLSPEATTGRMLHTFQATASEVAEFSFAELVKYELVSASTDKVIWKMETLYKYIHETREALTAQATNSQDANIRDNVVSWVKSQLEAIDWTDGYPCISVHVYSPRNDNVQANIMGTEFSWGEYQWAVGPENDYTITLPDAYEPPLKLVNATGYNDAGIIEMTILKNVSQDDESTDKQRVLTFYGWSGYGSDEFVSGDNPRQNNAYINDMLYELSTVKRAVIQEYRMEIHTLPVIETTVVTPTWWRNSANATAVNEYKILYDRFAIYHNNGHYYQYNGSTLVELEDYNANIWVRNPTLPRYQNPIDINTMQSGTSLPTIEYSDPNDVYLRLGSGVYANLYYQVQESTYSLESSVLQDASSNTEDSYRDWCTAAFNLTTVSLNTAKTFAATRPIFIWKNQRFIAITRQDLNNSEYTSYDLYCVANTTTSVETIKTARASYRSALADLDAKLKRNL